MEDKVNFPISDVKISAEQYKEILYEIGDNTLLAKQIMNKHDIDTIADLPLESYWTAKKEIRRINNINSELERSRFR